MGTWGHGFFEDDSALDFMADLEESDNPKDVIKEVFESAINSDYLESDEGTAIIVAAAYVDRQTNGTRFSPSTYIHPLSVDTFPERNTEIDLSDLRSAAVGALERVLSNRSELKELWEESGELGEWEAGVFNLGNRLKS
jgi:hypothetical protein